MDVIATLRKERGKMRITLESGQELLVPLSLFHERPLARGRHWIWMHTISGCCCGSTAMPWTGR